MSSTFADEPIDRAIRQRSTVHSYRSIARTVSAELGRVQLTKLRAAALDTAAPRRVAGDRCRSRVP